MDMTSSEKKSDPPVLFTNDETETKQRKVKSVPDMTLRSIYRKTLQTAIDIIKEIGDILTDKQYISQTVFQRRMVGVFTKPERRLYVGLWLVFFAFVFYFIDSTA